MKPLTAILFEPEKLPGEDGAAFHKIKRIVSREEAGPLTARFIYRQELVHKISVIPGVMHFPLADGENLWGANWVDVSSGVAGQEHPCVILKSPPWWLYSAVLASETLCRAITENAQAASDLARLSVNAPGYFDENIARATNRRETAKRNLLLAIQAGEWEKANLRGHREKLDCLARIGLEKSCKTEGDYREAWQRIERQIKRLREIARSK